MAAIVTNFTFPKLAPGQRASCVLRRRESREPWLPSLLCPDISHREPQCFAEHTEAVAGKIDWIADNLASEEQMVHNWNRLANSHPRDTDLSLPGDAILIWTKPCAMVDVVAPAHQALPMRVIDFGRNVDQFIVFRRDRFLGLGMRCRRSCGSVYVKSSKGRWQNVGEDGNWRRFNHDRRYVCSRI